MGLREWMRVFVCCAMLAGAAWAQNGMPALPDAPHPSVSPRPLTGPAIAPLTSEQKFARAMRHTFSPVHFVVVGAKAGLRQAWDNQPEYGQGAEGYGKRYGASFANDASGEFFSTFLFPSLLKQDPRYFRREHGGVGNRALYAATRIVWTRNDDGSEGVNWSRLLGGASSAALSNAYYPEADRTVASTFKRTGIRLAFSAGVNVAREFWPDIKKKVRKQ